MVKEVEIQDPSLKDRIKLQGKKIKGHVEKHKWVYVGGVVVVLSRGYFRPTCGCAPRMTIIDTVAKIQPMGILSYQKVQTNLVRIFTGNRGRPSNVVCAPDLDLCWKSQRKAAKWFGVSESHISNAVNGKIPKISGIRLVRPKVPK